jgi:hypothetical protein
LQDGALFGNQMGWAKIIYIAPVSFANIQKYVAQMHIYWVLKTFSEYSFIYSIVAVTLQNI